MHGCGQPTDFVFQCARGGAAESGDGNGCSGGVDLLLGSRNQRSCTDGSGCGGWGTDELWGYEQRGVADCGGFVEFDSGKPDSFRERGGFGSGNVQRSGVRVGPRLGELAVSDSGDIDGRDRGGCGRAFVAGFLRRSEC